MNTSLEVEYETDTHTQEQKPSIVHLFMDEASIEEMIGELEELLKGQSGDSIRLASEDWGRGDLTKTRYRAGSVAANFFRVWRV